MRRLSPCKHRFFRRYSLLAYLGAAYLLLHGTSVLPSPQEEQLTFHCFLDHALLSQSFFSLLQQTTFPFRALTFLCPFCRYSPFPFFHRLIFFRELFFYSVILFPPRAFFFSLLCFTNLLFWCQVYWCTSLCRTWKSFHTKLHP